MLLHLKSGLVSPTGFKPSERPRVSVEKVHVAKPHVTVSSATTTAVTSSFSPSDIAVSAALRQSANVLGLAMVFVSPVATLLLGQRLVCRSLAALRGMPEYSYESTKSTTLKVPLHWGGSSHHAAYSLDSDQISFVNNQATMLLATSGEVTMSTNLASSLPGAFASISNAGMPDTAAPEKSTSSYLMVGAVDRRCLFTAGMWQEIFELVQDARRQRAASSAASSNGFFDSVDMNPVDALKKNIPKLGSHEQVAADVMDVASALPGLTTEASIQVASGLATALPIVKTAAMASGVPTMPPMAH